MDRLPERKEEQFPIARFPTLSSSRLRSSARDIWVKVRQEPIAKYLRPRVVPRLRHANHCVVADQFLLRPLSEVDLLKERAPIVKVDDSHELVLNDFDTGLLEPISKDLEFVRCQ